MCSKSLDSVAGTVEMYEHLSQDLSTLVKPDMVALSGSEARKETYLNLLREDPKFTEWSRINTRHSSCIVFTNPARIPSYPIMYRLEALSLAIRFVQAYWKVHRLPFPKRIRETISNELSWMSLYPHAFAQALEGRGTFHNLLCRISLSNRFLNLVRHIPLMGSLKGLFSAMSIDALLSENRKIDPKSGILGRLEKIKWHCSYMRE